MSKLLAAFHETVESVVGPWQNAINKRNKGSVLYRDTDFVGVMYDVELVEERLSGLTMRYFTIELTGGAVRLSELNNLRRALETFCFYEEERTDVDGVSYQLGDGDDEQAVFFQNGKFRIWLRSWTE